MKLFFAMIGLLLLTVPVQAQHCRVSCNQVAVVQKVAAVQAVAVVPAPVVLYQSAGYARFDAELEAKITAAFEQGVKAGAREALQQFYADFQAEQASEAPVPVESMTTADHRQYIAANCLKCHNGPTGKGGIDLSKDDPLTLLLAADAVRHGRMPIGSGQPDAESAELLTGAAKGLLAPGKTP